MTTFVPDYQHIVDAACNREPARTPLYEHNISDKKIEEIMGSDFVRYLTDDPADLERYFAGYCAFFPAYGYDIVAYECCVGEAMPFSGALGKHADPVITCMEDFERYPWDGIEERYFQMFGPRFAALRHNLPAGTKAIGGVGNGIFECVQELTGYTGLCYIKYDDETLYKALFQRVGDLLVNIWTRFLREYGDLYCVCRFGDDLGFKSASLLSSEDIEQNILPQYKRIVGVIHSAGKPFLLHSCGCIFDVMEPLIQEVGIDAKHSNEDSIAPFATWLERYGSRIGNFGGIDTDVLCTLPPEEVAAYTQRVLEQCKGNGGYAIGSGNSIPDYVSTAGYLAMIDTVRRWRGETTL